MDQAEFFTIYDKLMRFASRKSMRFFHDEAQRQDAIDMAMARFVDNAGFKQVGDQLVTNPEILDLEVWGKLVITNALKDASKAKKTLDPINLDSGEYYGMHGYKVI